VAKLMDSS